MESNSNQLFVSVLVRRLQGTRSGELEREGADLIRTRAIGRHLSDTPCLLADTQQKRFLLKKSVPVLKKKACRISTNIE